MIRRLVAAETVEGFSKVYDSDLVAIVPGGGWIAHYTPDPDLPGSSEYKPPL